MVATQSNRVPVGRGAGLCRYGVRRGGPGPQLTERVTAPGTTRFSVVRIADEKFGPAPIAVQLFVVPTWLGVVRAVMVPSPS